MLKKFSAAALLGLASLTANANLIVDLELQLLADVSGSVSDSEYALQLSGYSSAFRDTDVINSILDTSNGKTGSIAVQYIEWSSSNQQKTQIDWMLINSQTSALAFADLLDGLTRAYDHSTGIANAIAYGASLFSTNAYDAARQVIDVSGDGNENEGGNVSQARDNALNAGIDSINGITIGNASGLTSFYQDNVVGGENAFHIHAETFEAFNTGIKRKLQQEISGVTVPEPATLALFGLGLFGMSRLRKAK